MDDGYVTPVTMSILGLKGIGSWLRLAFFGRRPVLNHPHGGHDCGTSDRGIRFMGNQIKGFAAVVREQFVDSAQDFEVVADVVPVVGATPIDKGFMGCADAPDGGVTALRSMASMN